MTDRAPPYRSHAHAYGHLTRAEKREKSITSVRESSVTCPCCDTHVMPVDLLEHLELRCAGPRDPGPGAKWVTWREALKMGVRKETLSRWVRNETVRFKGAPGDRHYLLRDLALRIALREANRRRQSHK